MSDVMLLCEFEGVLADTRAQRRRAMKESFADEGMALPESLYEKYCAGLPVEAAVEAALSALGNEKDGALQTLLALRARRHFASHAASGVTLSRGAATFVETAQASARIALVTRATRREMELMLGLAGLDAAFECVICAEDAPAPKPSGAPYTAALERLGRRRGVKRDSVIAIEDTLAGIHAAHDAGVRCIVVGAPPAHQRSEADAAVDAIAGHSPATLEALVAQQKRSAA
jgi:haloacid dehalogenase superfamily, subfamily IA, variant 3 with third motif having DD or ED